MTKVYEVNGVGVNTLKEVAVLLEVPRVSMRDLNEGLYPEVVRATEPTVDEGKGIETMEELDVALSEAGIEDKEPTLQDIVDASDGKVEIIMVGDAPKVETTTDTLPDTVEEFIDIGAHSVLPEHITEVLTNKEDIEEDTKVLTNKEDMDDVAAPTEEVEDAYVERDFPEVGYFADEKAIKKFVKALSNEELTDWVELEGVEYNENEHVAINRMRQAMAIRHLHFPDTAPKAKAKSKSKYAQYSTEDLVQMALDNNIEVRDDKGDIRILRMYTIMALRKKGLIG